MMKCRLAPDRSLTPALSRREREIWCRYANFIVKNVALPNDLHSGPAQAVELPVARSLR